MNASATEKRTGASLNRGGSKQDYETPDEFVAAVAKRFGRIEFDLAASPHNTKHRRYFSKEQDSLAQKWHQIGGLLWLNCEFANIDPWAEKCAAESLLGARIALLTPASVGTVWFAQHVHGRALVLGLSPRITFVGEPTPYPKDLMLSVFGPPGVVPWSPGFDVWRWRP